MRELNLRLIWEVQKRWLDMNSPSMTTVWVRLDVYLGEGEGT